LQLVECVFDPKLLDILQMGRFMKIKWHARILWLIALTSVLQGCATFVASELVPGERGFYYKPVFTDEILAIGWPDAALLKQMELSNTIAFIGKENTYMLYLGGEELGQISKLNLDGKRMTIASAQSLYLKDKQIWGEIELYYNSNAGTYIEHSGKVDHYGSYDKKEISVDEMTELEMGGFAPDQRPNKKGYFRTTIRIEGVVYPAIQIPEQQVSKLKVKRKFSLYNPREASPPILQKVLQVPVVVTGVAIDIMLAPVYLGVGGVVLLGAAVGGVAR
jgi:hypothetical protein